MKIMSKKIILVDIDGVVANLGDTWLERYNRDYNDNLTDHDIKSWATHEYVKPECGNDIYKYLEDDDLYDDVKIIKRAAWGIAEIQSMGVYRTVFATSTPHYQGGRKHRLLIEYGILPDTPFHKDYAEIHDKSLIDCDYIVDDGLHNLEVSSGKGIIFDQPWNREKSNPDIDFSNYVRAYGWKDVVTFFRQERVKEVVTELGY